MSPALLAAVSLAALSTGCLSWFAADRLLAKNSWTTTFFSRLRGKPKKGRPLILPHFGVLLRWWKKIQSQRRISAIRMVFPQTLGMAIQSLKTGQTFSQVLEYLSREGPSPLKEEWALVCAEMNLGASSEQTLVKMKERLGSFNDLTPFLESYTISRQTGANLIQLLEVLLEGLEEKNRILRKMETLTAQARLSGLMMGLLPFLLGAVFFILDPNLMLPLFTDKSGWALLFLAGILEMMGFAWIRQLLRLEV